MDINNMKLGRVRVKPILTFLLAALFFLVLAFVYFYPNDVRGDVMQQHDMIQGVANGQEILHYEQQSGRLSRWTDALFGGMPTFQIRPSYKSNDLLAAVGNIYSLKAFGVPDTVSWLFMLLLGFYILMLAFDLRWYYAVLGAVAYGFSSYFFILMGAGHIWQLLTLCYIPPTLAGVVMCYRGKWLGGAAVTAFFAAMQLLSNHVQMTYYSAFIMAALAIAYLCRAIKGKQVVQWAVATVILLLAGGLAIASAAPNLYMSNKYTAQTMRGGHSELTTDAQGKPVKANGGKKGLDKDYITMWSYGRSETFDLMIPNAKGGASIKPGQSPDDPTKITNNPLTLDQTSGYEKMVDAGEITDPVTPQVMPYFQQYFGDQPMTNGPVYIGALICFLFLLGCLVVKGPVKWALLVVTVLSILLSWGHNLMWFSDLFIDHFPLYNKFRNITSILIIAQITMPTLAVLGLCKIFTDPDFMRHHGKALYISAGISAAVCLLAALVPSVFVQLNETDQQLLDQLSAQGARAMDLAPLRHNVEAVRATLVSADGWRSLAFIVLGFLVLLAYGKHWFKAPVAVPVCTLAALALIDLYVADKRYVDQESFISADDVPATQIAERPADKQILRDTTHYRVLDVQHFGDATPSYFHNSVGGYHAAKLTRYNDLIDHQLSKGNQAVFNMLNTKYVIVDDNTVQPNPGALGNAWFVDTLTYVDNADQEMRFLDHFNPATHAVADKQFRQQLGQARPVSAGDTISLTRYVPDEVDYRSHSAQGGVAVFSEIYFPWGWQVTIDGKPVEMGRVNYVLRALQVPAGDHNIKFVFQPAEVDRTVSVATVAIIAILVLVLCAAVWPFVRRKNQTDKTE